MDRLYSSFYSMHTEVQNGLHAIRPNEMTSRDDNRATFFTIHPMSHMYLHPWIVSPHSKYFPCSCIYGSMNLSPSNWHRGIFESREMKNKYKKEVHTYDDHTGLPRWPVNTGRIWNRFVHHFAHFPCKVECHKGYPMKSIDRHQAWL